MARCEVSKAQKRTATQAGAKVMNVERPRYIPGVRCEVCQRWLESEWLGMGRSWQGGVGGAGLAAACR